MWVSTVANGLFYFDGENGNMIRYKNDKNSGGISSNLVNVVKCDSKGRVWVGTRDGLSLIGKDRNQISNYKHNPSDKNSLTSNYINAIIEDNHGSIWIGTTGM